MNKNQFQALDNKQPFLLPGSTNEEQVLDFKGWESFSSKSLFSLFTADCVDVSSFGEVFFSYIT